MTTAADLANAVREHFSERHTPHRARARTEALRMVRDFVGVSSECSWDDSTFGHPPEEWALVQHPNYSDDDAWVTCHLSPKYALEYAEQDSDDWRPVLLVNLDHGSVYEIESKVMYKLGKQIDVD